MNSSAGARFIVHPSSFIVHRSGVRAAAGYAKFMTNSTPATPWGRPRTDAFGMIFNRVTSIDLGIPSNSKPPDAPVSYPFL